MAPEFSSGPSSSLRFVDQESSFILNPKMIIIIETKQLYTSHFDLFSNVL